MALLRAWLTEPIVEQVAGIKKAITITYKMTRTMQEIHKIYEYELGAEFSKRLK